MAQTVDSSMGGQFKKQLTNKRFTFKSVTAMILFGAIIMVFVFFGLPGQMGEVVGSAGSVNGQIISLLDLQQEEERVQQYYASIFGGKMDFSNQKGLLRQQAVENLVQAEVLSQSSQSAGILISDAEVINYITKEIPFLQKEGVFQREYYSRYLEMNRLAPVDFETKVRKSMVNFKTRELFQAATMNLSFHQEKQSELKKYKYNLAFVKINREELEKKDAKIKDLFEEAIKSIEASLKDKNETILSAELKKLGLSWEETGEFDLSADSIPKIMAPDLIEKVVSLKNDQPYLETLIMGGGDRYLVKLKSLKIDNSKTFENINKDQAVKMRANSLFESWLASERKLAKVVIPAQVLKN